MVGSFWVEGLIAFHQLMAISQLRAILRTQIDGHKFRGFGFSDFSYNKILR